MSKVNRRSVRCSFCGKGEEQVRKLVAGPGVYICNQCVELCNEVLRKEPPPQSPAPRVRVSWVQKLREKVSWPWLRRTVAGAS